MNTENESVERLEIGKDYVDVYDSNIIIIDRVGNFDNKGFYKDLYRKHIACTNYGSWREATEEEVIEAFKKHLVYRYGEDWKTMKIKERHPALSSSIVINNGSWNVAISKLTNGWNVWNRHGLLYRNGIWVKRLEEVEEPVKSTDWSPAPEDIEAMNKKEKASETQIGGSHYSDMAIQPVEFIHKNGLSFIQGNIIKYVCRYKSKNGIKDLLKAKHYIDLLIEFEEE